ncbi:hypothetical protein J4423_02665 [Candidatus Pacearchaeota archaeon]|nr:hypothetical protein [Candidatus Pacearchaeota archaeon]
MGNITLSMPDELLRKMRMLREIKWSEVARRAIQQRIEDLMALEKIASKSKLTEKDVEDIGEKIKRGIAKRHGL